VKTRYYCWWVIAIWILGGVSQGLAEEGVRFITNRPPVKKFELFKVGPRTYTNLIVTARTEVDVFIRHQSGIGNFKLDELSDEQRELLGYPAEKKEPSAPSPVETATKATEQLVGQFQDPETREKLSAFAQQVKARISGQQVQAGDEEGVADSSAPPLTPQDLLSSLPREIVVVLTAFLVMIPLIHFFFAYTAGMICRKAGHEPGFLVWMPILGIIPLLKAAKLSPWLLVLFFVPFVNLLMIWFLFAKISQARGKGILTTLGLVFPPMTAFTWLYLAYSR